MTPPPICSRCQRVLPADAPNELCPYCLLSLGSDDLEETAAIESRLRFEAPDVEELQRHFDVDQLQIVGMVGRGGMGAVYQAVQPRLSRDVAIKVLPPELAATPGFDERFQQEAKVLAKLDHPAIVDVFDFGQAGPYSYLMIEFVDGVNLRRLMADGGMQPSDALQIVPQICEALQFAHDHGIVHRDIKPENVLIDSSGRVKITDFGLAKLARGEGRRNLTGTQQVMGTPHYMAPEQIERPREVDHRADIYALGVVFYELLTGELPIGRFDPPSHKSNAGKGLDRIVMKALNKEPSRRYEQASHVKSDVERESDSSESQREQPSWREAWNTTFDPLKEKTAKYVDKVSDRVRTATDEPDSRGSGLSRRYPIAVAGLTSSALAMLMFLLSGGDEDAIPWMAILLVIGYLLARFAVPPESKLNSLSRKERMMLFPPILALLIPIVLLIAIAPGAITMAIVEGITGGFLFAFAVAGAVLCGWLFVLVVIAKRFRSVVKWLLYPFLSNWNGKGTFLGGAVGAIGGILCSIAAWNLG